MSVELKVFKAGWCQPCKSLEPTLKELEEEGHNITYVDIDKEGSVAVGFNIRSVPTMIIMKEGKEAGRIIGNKSKEEILISLEA